MFAILCIRIQAAKMNDVVIKTIEDVIYGVRGKQVMLDSDYMDVQTVQKISTKL